MGRHFLGIVVLFLLIGVYVLASDIRLARTESATIIVPDDFLTIQEAINNAVDGDAIFVKAGIYYEHVVVNKMVALVGEDVSTTIVDGNSTGHVISVIRDNVSITGFTVQRSGRTPLNAGISLSNIRGCDVSRNCIVDNEVGVYGSPKNTSISNNTITNNHIGVAIDPGATYNIISRNRLIANNVSIHMYYANSNNVSKNNMTNNRRSITLGYSRNNRFYHNDFFNDTKQILIFPSTYANFWDNGIEGNYWSDYNGTDANDDGIGEIPYEIDSNNSDTRPLMGMFHSFNTSLGKYVNVISNSTIDDFEYCQPCNFIRMHVSNMTVNQTHGFCRISIPYEVMSEPFNVTINGANPAYWNYTLYDNGTHRWIYFAYEHSTLEIVIIPEFSSLIILPLFMITTLLTALMYRRKKFTRPSAHTL